VGNTFLNNSTSGEITGPVGIGGVGSKKPHVVPLGADHKGKLGLVVGSTDSGSSLSELLELLAVGQLMIKPMIAQAYSTTWAY
jgi:hypothetical protein